MNYKPLIIIALIIAVALVAVSSALHTYEEGNITLEEHHDHDTQEHDHDEEKEEHIHEENEKDNSEKKNTS